MLPVDLAKVGLELNGTDQQDGVGVVGERLGLVEVEEVPGLALEEVDLIEVGLYSGGILLADVQLLSGRQYTEVIPRRLSQRKDEDKVGASNSSRQDWYSHRNE